ncbi:MAG: hypothetical protein ABJL35_08635 [Parasphingorhabdus sp.]
MSPILEAGGADTTLNMAIALLSIGTEKAGAAPQLTGLLLINGS